MRVATFNIHHGAPPRRRYSRSELRRAVQRLGVDVLALQEVDRHVSRSRFSDQTKIVAEATGLCPVFARARSLGPFGEYGIALLAPEPPSAVEVVALPRFGREQRLALLASIRVNGQRVSVCVTHLQNNPGIARDQLDVVLDRFMARPGPHLLMGDLNGEPKRLGRRIERAGLTRADAAPSFPTHDPRLSIDWIATSGFTISEVSVPRIWLSDHFPVVGTLT